MSNPSSEAMSVEKRQVKVFFLEDNRDDVELELYELRKAGYAVEYAVAMNKKEFMSNITSFSPDIILADYSLPDITGIEAIALCRDLKISVPVILVTGEGNEQIAVDSLRLGAIDYIIKKNISGLPARISRALDIWADRRARERAEAEEKRLQYMLFETQKMESIGRLAGGIAHDFNNILTGVMGYAELCMKEVPKESQVREKLEAIVAFSKRGADVVKQLLIFSKKVPLEFETVDINAFLQDTVRFLRRMIEETVEIRLELCPGIVGVSCDTRQFARVFMNLALNARDAMNGKGILTIKTEKTRADDAVPKLPLPGSGEFVCISVSDTGGGIDPKHIESVFDPFFTTKQPGKGTGLGLAIVQSVVHSHNGIIRVVSNQGAGTVFLVYLPLVSLNAPVKTGTSPDMPEAAKTSSGPARILVVEDEDMLRDLLSTTVVSLGYQVLAAKNGSEALNIYRTSGNKIDLIISDMRMPLMGGVDLFKEVRAIDPGAKFILVTGYSIADQDRDILSKMNAILAKPYTFENISASIRAVLTA